MSRVIYQEPFLSYAEQIDLLKSRGLSFIDEAQALNLFEYVSYYRLSSYWHPFLEDKQNKTFRENANFDAVFELYKFDMNLRKMIMAEIEKIEIAVRSKMAYVLSLSNDSFWLENESLFSYSEKYASLILSIKKEIDRSDENFMVSFKREYSNDIPPAFMVLETTSFGTLSKLYKLLKSSKEKQEIANFFGLLDKWLDNKQISNNRIYFVLSMIIYLLNIINPKHSLKQRLTDLFSKYPGIDKAGMGFPVNWQEESLWN